MPAALWVVAAAPLHTPAGACESALVPARQRSTHIERLKMRGATDAAIWSYARDHGYTIVSKDNDFRQYAFLYGPPPKAIWLAAVLSYG